VGGGDEAPFRAGGGSAAALEAVAAPVEFRVGEDRLDHALAFGVETAAVVGVEHAAHEGVKAAVPARAGALALAGVGQDQHLHAAADDRIHLHVMPVAGVGEHDLWERVDPDGGEPSRGRVDHWFQLPEVGRVDGPLGGDHDLLGGDAGSGVVACTHPREVFTLRESGLVTLIFPAGGAGGW